MEEADVVDKFKLVYLTFMLHGIGVLMPWNMFITAVGYFTDFKLAKEYVGEETQYAASFLQFLGFAAQVPNITFSWLNIFVQIGGGLTSRIIWSITTEVIIFIITIFLAMIDTSAWPGGFFWITMITVVLLNMANGIYQNTIFGVAAQLPIKYTGAVILGTNISGTFTALVLILSDSFTSTRRTSAIYYFITAVFTLLVCYDSYFALPLNKFYRYYHLKEKKRAQTQQNTQAEKTPIPYWQIYKQAIMQLYNVFFLFFVTLSVFPAIYAQVKAVDENFPIPPKYFMSVTCFLTFNLFAALGSYVATRFAWPSPKFLWIPVTLRVLYIPFFLLCNYQIESIHRTLPVLFKNDWIYWFVAATMSYTSGYFSSLGMMYAPRTVEPAHATTAGMFAGAMLVSGIFFGILSSFLWPPFIQI